MILQTKVGDWYDRISTQIKTRASISGNSTLGDWLLLGPVMEDPSKIKYEITKFPLFMHIFGAVFCMGCSAIFHLFYVHSPGASQYLSRLDYAGISLLIAFSSLSPLYYNYYCEDMHGWRAFYMTSELTASALVFIVSLWPKFDKP